MEKKGKQSTENFIKEIRRKTRRVFSSEQKIMIVMEAQRGESSVAEICRKHAIAQSIFYKWNKEFMEAGKKRLAGDTAREATSDEVADLRKENQRLKEMVADLMLRYTIVKKAWTCWTKRKIPETHETHSSRKARDHMDGRALRSWCKPDTSSTWNP